MGIFNLRNSVNKRLMLRGESRIHKPLAYEPKLINRWYVEFPGEFNFSKWTVYKVERPNYFPSTRSWSDMVIYINDTVNEPATEIALNGINNISFITNPMKTYKIAMLDPTGLIVEMLGVTGTLEEVKFSDLNYESDGELANVVMRIKVRAVEKLPL